MGPLRFQRDESTIGHFVEPQHSQVLFDARRPPFEWTTDRGEAFWNFESRYPEGYFAYSNADGMLNERFRRSVPPPAIEQVALIAGTSVQPEEERCHRG